MNKTYSFDYVTLEDRASIISANPTYVLVEERNLFTGNTLIFSDNADAIYAKSLEDQLLLAENTIAGGIL